MRLLAALVLLLATPASAAAAPFGELPSQPEPAVGCLAATGAPGELTRRGDRGAILEAAGPDGLRPLGEIGADVVINCPRLDARPNGAGVAAFHTQHGVDTFVEAAVREPGGAWGPVTDVMAALELAVGNPLAAAVSERGDAVVVAALQPSRLQIRVSRRAPGGAFGAPETLFDRRTGDSQAPTVQAGMSASGEAVVAWSFRSRDDLSRELWAAIAPPGGAFGAPARIGSLQLGTPFSLAVGAGGHALLAFATGTELRVAERAPGAGFAAAAAIAPASDPVAVLPTAAIDAAGGAIVAWERATDWHVEAVVRSGPGAFGAPVTLGRPIRRLGLPKELISLFTGFAIEPEGEYTSGEVGPDAQSGHPRAVIDASGRALLTWVAPARRDGVWWTAPWAATLPLAGGAPETHALGAGLRDTRMVTPLLLAGGGAAVAWGDDVDEGNARLHLALEGAPATPETVPLVRIQPPRKRVLARSDALVLRVTCSAACEVRAQLGPTLTDPSDTLKLTRAGSGQLRLRPELRPIAPAKRGPVRVRVRAGAPDARVVPTETVTVNLRRRPGPPPPRIVGATARRSGKAAIVRWRMTRAADPDELLVMATEGRGTAAIGVGDARGGPRRFTARVRNVARARYVTILGGGDAGTPLQVTRVRIRR